MNNPDPSLRKPAEDFLRSNERSTGFCSAMLEVSSNSALPTQTRYLAAIYLKNNIVRYWAPRDTSLTSVTPEEKAHLRRRCLELLNEQDDEVAVQKAISISKMAKSDYPAEWPDLFGSLSNLLSGADTERLLRVLGVLHFVLKELSSKCLVQDRKRFQELAPGLLGFVKTHWTGCAQLVCEGGAAGIGPEALRGLTLSSKVLRRIMLFGFTQLFGVPEAVAVVRDGFEL